MTAFFSQVVAATSGTLSRLGFGEVSGRRCGGRLVESFHEMDVLDIGLNILPASRDTVHIIALFGLNTRKRVTKSNAKVLDQERFERRSSSRLNRTIRAPAVDTRGKRDETRQHG